MLKNEYLLSHFNPSQTMATNITFTTKRGSYAYNTDDYITRGGQASLYLGRNVATNQEVAIRLIGLADYENATMWFQREKDLEKLRHSNIVKVLDFHETTDDHGKPRGYIIQEFIKGKTLLKKTEEWETSSLPEHEINEGKFQVMIDALSGLDYLHRNNIIHRDISPNNIMIAENGQVKIIDFGLAKDITDPTQSFTRVVPSFIYSPLEMGNTDPAPTIDVYSIAIVFYEMLTGIQLYSKNSVPSVVLPKHREFIGTLEKHERIHPKLLSVLQKASSVNKELRYKSASEFQQALLGIRDVVLKVNKEPAQRTKKKFSFSALQPKHFIMGALAVVICVALGIYRWSDDGYKEAVEGEKYFYGLGVSIDKEKAIQLWQKSAAKNHPIGLYNLGCEYQRGFKYRKDTVEARKYFTQALRGLQQLAKEGDAVAQYDLANMYRSSQGVVKESKDSTSYWYKKSADQGYARAQSSLGWMYYWTKNGVPSDTIKAITYFRKAAEQNFAEGLYSLGEAYGFGIGVTTNATKRVELYHKAAEQGYDHAQYRLGLLFNSGNGVAIDTMKAFFWYRKAAKQGHPEAKQRLQEMGATE